MAPAQEYIDFTVDGNQNAPSPESDESNNKSASSKSLEYQHAHLHHTANAKNGGEDEVLYSHGKTPIQNAAGSANVSQGPSHPAEPEKRSLDQFSVEEDPQSHTLSAFYSRYRLFFHLFVWLVFTGSAASLLDLSMRTEFNCWNLFSKIFG